MVWRRPLLAHVFILLTLSVVSCARRWPTEAELQPLVPLFERLAKNPVAVHAQLEGHALTFRGQILKTGIATSTDEKLVTAVVGNVAITKLKSRKRESPYVITYPPGQPGAGVVICFVDRSDSLADADSGRYLLASGQFSEIDTSGDLPAIILSDCQIFGVK
jgi:hypothetical protein